jgi:hypothetical protein
MSPRRKIGQRMCGRRDVGTENRYNGLFLN